LITFLMLPVRAIYSIHPIRLDFIAQLILYRVQTLQWDTTFLCCRDSVFHGNWGLRRRERKNLQGHLSRTGPGKKPEEACNTTMIGRGWGSFRNAETKPHKGVNLDRKSRRSRFGGCAKGCYPSQRKFTYSYASKKSAGRFW
jgi:hypothetical protein